MFIRQTESILHTDEHYIQLHSRLQLLPPSPRVSRCIKYKFYIRVHTSIYLLSYIDLEANIAALANSFTKGGSKIGIPPCLKKSGSATTKPRVEISIVWTRTARRQNSLDLAASRFEYFWSL